MQRGVHCRLMDNSTSVREAAVELLGRFVLSRPELIEQYYDMLIERILVIPSALFSTLFLFGIIVSRFHMVTFKWILVALCDLCKGTLNLCYSFK